MITGKERDRDHGKNSKEEGRKDCVKDETVGQRPPQVDGQAPPRAQGAQGDVAPQGCLKAACSCLIASGRVPSKGVARPMFFCNLHAVDFATQRIMEYRRVFQSKPNGRIY